MIKASNKLLYIPMKGFVESFNVSVGTALFLYEITRQRNSNKKVDYKLNKKDQAKLLVDFKKR